MADYRYAVDAAGAALPDYGTDTQELSTNETSNLENQWAEDFTGLDEAIARNQLDNETNAASAAQSVGGAGGGSEDSEYRENPLDKFVNYTYGLTLSASKPKSFGTEDQVMIASGGRRENRSPIFYDDMYFENFQMTTVIGLNSRSRSSNVIDISFTVIEPYGITLINRILDLAKDLGVENWTEMSFVLRIDFFGNNESGMPDGPLDGQTKYIPMKIIGCEMKASTKGSEYKFTGIPYHHLAYQETSGSTPVFVEVTAETVKDFFNGDGGYAKALNDYQKKLKKDEYVEIPDEYEFVVTGELGQAKILTKKEKNHVSHIPLAHDNNKSAKTEDGIKAANSRFDEAPAKLDQKKQAIPINAGTSIIDVINQTVRNSEYIVKQVGKPSGGTVKWYKIVPEVKVLGYDSKRKVYAKKYIYTILETEVYNTKYPDAPLGQPKVAVKKYNYMYTGKNQQILDFSLDFNIMFYTAVTSNRYKLKRGDTSPEPPDPKDKDKGITNDTKESDVTPAHVKIVPAQTDVSSLHQGANDVTNTSANDLYKSLMSTSRGDMINVKLKIAGDPEFIKQDDIAYASEGTVNEIDQNGSITTDGGELYVDLFFRSPNDINQETGLYDFSRWEEASFNGRYKVITVENIFSQGQFLQNLNLVRIFNQETPGGAGDGASGNDAPAGAGEMSEADAANETQRLLNRAETIASESAASSANNETSARDQGEGVDASQQQVMAMQNNFSNVETLDVTAWNQ